MAISAGTVVADAKMNMRGFMRDLKVMRKSGSKAAERVSRKWKDVGGQFQRVGGMLTAGLTAPLLGAGGLALKTAADYESLRQSMDILNKSASEGARNFRRLKEFSARTPFQLKDLAQAQNMLQGFGLSADQAFESMSMIGDIAAVASGNIQGIGIAFGQAAAEGRLMTRDIRQLINQGVPAIKLLANTMNVAESSVLDLASQGKISFEILQQAFEDATSEGGMFADGMKKQAQTLSGVWSTLKDNASLALGEIGQSLAEAFDIKGIAKSLIANLQAFTDWFSKLSPVVKKTSFIVGGLAAAIGPVSLAIGTIISIMPTLIAGFSALFSPVTAISAAIAGLVVVGKNMYDNWDIIVADLTELWEGIELTVWEIVGGIMDAFTFMSKGILNTLSSMAGAIQPSLVAPMEIAKQRIKNANESIQGHIKASRKEYEKAGKSAAEARMSITSLSESFFDLWSSVKSATSAMIENRKEQQKHAASGSKGFSGQNNPIDRASMSASSLVGTLEKVKIKSTEALAGMRAAVNPALEGMSLLEIATMNTTDKVTQAAQTAGQALGQMFDQALLHGRNFMGVVKNIIKQLASRVFVQGVMAVITGGASLAKGSIGSAIFGGLFHGGGMVPGSGERMIRAKGGEMVLTQSQQKALGSMMGGGQSRTQRIKLQVRGEFRQQGSDLRAVINESQHIDLS